MKKKIFENIHLPGRKRRGYDSPENSHIKRKNISTIDRLCMKPPQSLH